MTLRLPEKAGERRVNRVLEKTAALLHANRVRRVLPSLDFALSDRLLSLGFTPIGRRALLRAMAGQILVKYAPSHDLALISSRRADADTLRALRQLAPAFRRVVLDMPPREAEILADRLWSLGLSPEPLPRSRTVDADAAAILSLPEKPLFLPLRCAFLSPNGPAGIIGGREVESVRFTVPERYRDTLPDRFDPSALLSEALDTGRLSPADVRIAP